MATTIDKAGRVVIPADIRAKAGLRPGTELDVVLDDVSIRLIPRIPGPKLVKSGRRWVARPVVPEGERTKVDVGALIEEERNRWPW
jgi:AbrB family looped-hinge helix DNA binding protein